MEVPQRKSLVPFPEDARLPGPVAGPLSAVLKERPSRPVLWQQRGAAAEEWRVLCQLSGGAEHHSIKEPMVWGDPLATNRLLIYGENQIRVHGIVGMNWPRTGILTHPSFFVRRSSRTFSSASQATASSMSRSLLSDNGD